MDNLKSSVSSNKINFIVKNLPTKKTRPDGSVVNFTKLNKK